jgi:hypothetical protein
MFQAAFNDEIINSCVKLQRNPINELASLKLYALQCALQKLVKLPRMVDEGTSLPLLQQTYVDKNK